MWDGGGVFKDGGWWMWLFVCLFVGVPVACSSPIVLCIVGEGSVRIASFRIVYANLWLIK